jgi:hypothetical protein
MTTRLLVGYALIALLVLATAAAIWWKTYYNSPRRVHARARARHTKRLRRRDEAAAAREVLDHG